METGLNYEYASEYASSISFEASQMVTRVSQVYVVCIWHMNA